MSANKLLTCPYDEAHKVKSTRMQLHITRCRLNHLNEIKFTCPFNATHVLPYQERDYHLLHCSDKAPLDRMLAESLDKNNPFKGRTAVPNYSEPLPSKVDEVWEVEEDYEPMPGYLPAKERPTGSVVHPAPFLGASVKRHLYQELHQQPESIDFKSYLNSGSSIPAPIPRQPKQPSEASRFELGDDFPFLGLGRAKNKNALPVRSYSSVVGNRMNYPSINMNDAEVDTNSTIVQRDVTAAMNSNAASEFLPMGLGRGRIGNFFAT